MRAMHSRRPARRDGVATYRACATELIDYTERLMRSEIAHWPDGSHEGFDETPEWNGCGATRAVA